MTPFGIIELWHHFLRMFQFTFIIGSFGVANKNVLGIWGWMVGPSTRWKMKYFFSCACSSPQNGRCEVSISHSSIIPASCPFLLTNHCYFLFSSQKEHIQHGFRKAPKCTVLPLCSIMFPWSMTLQTSCIQALTLWSTCTNLVQVACTCAKWSVTSL